MHLNVEFFAALIGSLIGIFVLSFVTEWTIVRPVCGDPVRGKIASVFAALFIACVLSLLDDHLSRNVLAAYGISALVVGIVQYRAGCRLREQQRRRWY